MRKQPDAGLGTVTVHPTWCGVGPRSKQYFLETSMISMTSIIVDDCRLRRLVVQKNIGSKAFRLYCRIYVIYSVSATRRNRAHLGWGEITGKLDARHRECPILNARSCTYDARAAWR